MTTVSVAMGTFNGASHVREQLASILTQTIPVDELVVGDDGSSDGTLDHIRQFWAAAVRPPVLRILPQAPDRLGVARNFERVLAATSGDVVLLSDQDDVWMPGRVASSLDHLDAHSEVDLLFGDARLVDSDGSPLGATLFESLPMRPEERDGLQGSGAFAILLRRNLVTGATVALRRRLLASALPIPRGWLHDEWLALAAALDGAILMVPEQLIDYRQHPSNMIGVTAPTLRYRIGRMLEPRGNRNSVLADRMLALEERLAVRSDLDPARTDAVVAKSTFELARASLPDARLARVPGVIRIAATGRYGRFASQGRLDILRDLLQPR